MVTKIIGYGIIGLMWTFVISADRKTLKSAQLGVGWGDILEQIDYILRIWDWMVLAYRLELWWMHMGYRLGRFHFQRNKEDDRSCSDQPQRRRQWMWYGWRRTMLPCRVRWWRWWPIWTADQEDRRPSHSWSKPFHCVQWRTPISAHSCKLADLQKRLKASIIIRMC